MEPYWDSVKRIVKESDVVLEILDSRLAEDSRNIQLEKIIEEAGRPRIFVINKSDLVSKHALKEIIEKIKAENKGDVVYVSAKKRKTIRNLLVRLKQVFGEYGKREPTHYRGISKARRKYREARGDIVVGVVGYPNVGKSSIINALAFKKKAQVSSKAGTTHGIHWISAGEGIKFIDTPGVIPFSNADETTLGLMGARSPEKLKDTEVVAMRIIEMFVEKNKTAFEKFYDFKLDNSWNSCEALENLAIAKGHLKKGGVADEMRVSTMIVRDWQTGKLRL